MPEPVPLSKVKDLLVEEAARRTLPREAGLAHQHAELFARLSSEQTAKLLAELRTLPFVDATVAVKIADVLPSTRRRSASSSRRSGSRSTKRRSPGSSRSWHSTDERGGSGVENYAIILDYLPNGRQTERGFHREPLALAIGEDELKLFELVPRPRANLTPGMRVPLVPVGTTPSPIDHVRRRVGYDEITVAARTELAGALESIVKRNSVRYLRFFNDAPAVSRRFHLLELLPGIGKKTMQQIVDERKSAPFASFEEIESRVHLKNPERLIVGRIEQELSGVEDKYRLFVAP
ncbi:MAG: DUF655 domain-containing protein [Candidatus Lutacidiplasmatales archaeon]